MMQITEDTPPDMLAGAMDLTIHLPTGQTVKMSVERSTPMMDLLVQITTAHHLQHSGHILQAMEMVPSLGYPDKILPYKPNTPIGALDTQYIKVVPKNRSITVPKHLLLGRQPFESTFRLQVHLPRNQLYVIRVSQNVYLEDIMKKVCDEKNLDSVKYEFRHPGNLDEVLDPKLTLSDYQITEVYVVAKGSVGLTQTFSSNDIMALRKEEERKQLQARTGGGVFSLIFKRGKPNMGSGSLSSDNRSISPSHSDDSRSVTPPAIQQQILLPTMKEAPNTLEKPKVPQRKRRPAPKPPQQEDMRKDSTDKPPSQISSSSDCNTHNLQLKKGDNGLTICHSRNSSDSSGYHEPSVLSDNCNTSLPRRCKSTLINEVVSEEVCNGESNKNGNLTKMSKFSKSTTSIASRKKKAAPPPPLVIKSDNVISNPVNASPVVANLLVETKVADDESKSNTIIDVHKPSAVVVSDSEIKESSVPLTRIRVANRPPKPLPRIKPVVVDKKTLPQTPNCKEETTANLYGYESTTSTNQTFNKTYINKPKGNSNNLTKELEIKSEEALVDTMTNSSTINNSSNEMNQQDKRNLNNGLNLLNNNPKPPEVVGTIPKKSNSSTSLNSIVSSVDTIGRKSGFKIGSSLLSLNGVDDFGLKDTKTFDSFSLNSDYSMSFDEYEISNINLDLFNFSYSKRLKQCNNKKALHGLDGVYNLDLPQKHKMLRNNSSSSLTSTASMPCILEQSISNKMTDSCFGRNRWVVGDTGDTGSDLIVTPEMSSSYIDSTNVSEKNSKRNSLSLNNENKVTEDLQNHLNLVAESIQFSPNGVLLTETDNIENKISSLENNSANITKDKSTVKIIPDNSEKIKEIAKVDVPSTKLAASDEFVEVENEEWQYQLPSPPTAFRDSSPTNLTDVTNYDTITLQDFKEESVITNPELFEKLKIVKDNQYDTETVSDFNSVLSDEEKPMFSKLTLENLEKRKSLVYNRELSTSLKIAQNNVSFSSNADNKTEDETINKRSSVLSELEQVIQNGNKPVSRHNSFVKDVKAVIDSSLPNFKISTYDKPKSKINIFEDDTVRSNVENSFKTNSFTDLSNVNETIVNNNNKLNYNSESGYFTTNNTFVGQSLENISFRKHSLDNHFNNDIFKKPHEFSKYRSASKNNFFIKHQPGKSHCMTRSESFSLNNNVSSWKPHNPVQRSKSTVALNKYKDDHEIKVENGDTLSKSNSLFDVSGLHSLEVIRMIQTKLNTPNNSTEEIIEHNNNNQENNAKNINNSTEYTTIAAESNSTTNTKTYKYRGPPAINLSTWSERPKTVVSLKEDTDYKINCKINNNNSNNNNNNSATTINNSKDIEITHHNDTNISKNDIDAVNVTVKVNGSESIKAQESGNLIIKIGESQTPKSLTDFSTRFINHTTAVGYRKPLANINKIEKTPRPHSIAFDSDFDISRVPIVRSVELKKSFKDNSLTKNKFVTKINSYSNETSNGCDNKYNDIYHSTEFINEINNLKPQSKNSSIYVGSESTNKPTLRINNFAQNRPAPVVLGFRQAALGNDNTARSRKSWNGSNNYNAIPLKATLESPVKNTVHVPNSNVPFSQVTLKKLDLNKNQQNGTCVNTFFGNVVLKNTSKSMNRNVNNRYSIGSQLEDKCEDLHNWSNGNEFVKAPPPPPPSIPKDRNVTKKLQNSESSVDSRDELLNSIRNFGGIKGLKHIKA